MQTDEKQIALVFKALCDENRVRIIKYLRAGEKCACRILEEIAVTQPTLSHHMKILCDSGIVVARKDGKWMYYSISARGAQTALEYLREVTAADCVEVASANNGDGAGKGIGAANASGVDTDKANSTGKGGGDVANKGDAACCGK